MKRYAWLALLLVSCSSTDGPTTEAPRAERGDFVVTAYASGELRAVLSERLVAPPLNQRMRVAMLVDDGATVEAGQPVAAFDPQEVRTALRDREADLGSARKELEKLALESRSELDRLAVERERTAVELEKAKTRASIDADVTPGRDILKAMAEVEALTITHVEKVKAEGFAQLRHARKKSALEASLLNADRGVALAKSTLQAMNLTAPVAGTALVADTWTNGGQRKLQIGDNVWRGQDVVTIPDLSVMEALVFVDEADISRVRIGQPVTARLDAAPERVFPGTVKFVPSLAETLSWSNPAKVFRVVAALAETDPELMRPGLRLQAEIEVERQPEAITVPLLAVLAVDGHTFVELADGSRKEVTLGDRNDARVVVEGLEAGTTLRAASVGEP